MIHPYPICAIVGEEVLASEPIVSGSTFATHIASVDGKRCLALKGGKVCELGDRRQVRWIG